MILIRTILLATIALLVLLYGADLLQRDSTNRPGVEVIQSATPTIRKPIIAPTYTPGPQVAPKEGAPLDPTVDQVLLPTVTPNS